LIPGPCSSCVLPRQPYPSYLSYVLVLRCGLANFADAGLELVVLLLPK
jgi:hypothetical protein